MPSDKEKTGLLAVIHANATVHTLYDTVLQYLRSLGPVEALPHKTQISFRRKGTKTSFSLIWIPYWVNKSMPENVIVLAIYLPRRVSDKRIRESVKIREGRWVHHVPLAESEDLDRVVKNWLKESYELVEPPHNKS